jgi:hypothetical protein
LFAALTAVTPVRSAASCDVCRLQLHHRSGPYSITLSKERWGGTRPRFLVRLTNRSAGALVLGRSAPPFVLNFITPRYRGTERLRSGPRSTRVPSGSTFTFSGAFPYRLSAAGTYEMNVSFRNVDSTTLTYVVR